MRKRIQTATDLSVEELDQYDRQAKEGVNICLIKSSGSEPKASAPRRWLNSPDTVGVGAMSWSEATTDWEQINWGTNVIKIRVLLRF